MTTTLDHRPSDAYRLAAALAAMSDRPAAALRTILRERGHGSVTELHNALHVSKTTIRNWQPGGGWQLGPDQVYQLAIAYAARSDEAVTDPSTVDLDDDTRKRVDELFDLMYSDNHRDAVTWLSRYKPDYLRCCSESSTWLVA